MHILRHLRISKFGIALALVWLMAPVPLRAGAGTVGDEFLKIGIGARPAAMGSAYLALADDATAPQWNPAGLAQVTLPEITFMHLAYFADINYEYVGAVLPWRGQGLGLGVTWLNVPSFNSTGDPTATLGSAADYALSLAYAFSISKDLQIGATGRAIISDLAGYSATGGALDLGATFRPFGRNLGLAVVAQNLGAQSGYDGSSDPLPVSLRMGAAYSLFDRSDIPWLNLAVDVNKSLENVFKFNLGVEAWAFESLAVRAGYQMSEGGQDLANTDANTPANMTVGLGLRLGAAQVDYALVPMGELGLTHRVSLSWRFGYAPKVVDREALVSSAPKMASAGEGPAGVAFNLDANKALNGVPVREWKVEIRDPDGNLVRTLSGQGPVPRNLAWDLKDANGKPAPRDLPYKYAVSLRDWNGSAVSTEGFIAKEVRPKELMDSTPRYDAASGGLVFKPRASMSVGVREWKLNIRDAEGNVLKTLTGTGAIPKALVWKPEEGAMGKDADLLAGRSVAAIKYDLEFKDAGGQAKVVSEQVRFKMGQAEETAYKLPLPLKDFKVNKGREILVASLPNLTSTEGNAAKGAPFVMPVPEGGVTGWRFDITDAKGQLVRSFSGKSGAPENIFWDGLDSNGVAVRDPEKARFKFTVTGAEGEKSTDARKAVRSPFNIATAEGRIQRVSGIWFRFLDTDIQDAVVGKLKEVALMLRHNPGVQVSIQGHAWDEGPDALRLSQDRADTVLRYLVEQEGLSPRNISSIGYGETMPLENARTEDAAAKNRRVEVILVSKP
jgi:outer membrane protein OmpA-like peptidoglycan-associated protein